MESGVIGRFSQLSPLSVERKSPDRKFSVLLSIYVLPCIRGISLLTFLLNIFNAAGFCAHRFKVEKTRHMIQNHTLSGGEKTLIASFSGENGVLHCAFQLKAWARIIFSIIGTNRITSCHCY